MKILVTGALGFIGSHITERLVEEEHDVFALDNLHTGSESNIHAVKDKIKLFKKSAGDVSSLDEKFDVIFHEGIYSSSPMYKESPSLTARVLEEWISILEYSRKNDTKIVFASSSSLYNGNNPPHREDMPILVTDFYTEARYSMERLAKLYSDLYSLNVVGLRYFSVYGSHERSKGKYANLITQFLWEMKTGKQPVILGDGTQTRDFIYVNDVVEANLLALRYNKSDVFNVGTGRSTALNEIVILLNKELGTSIHPTYEQNKIKNYVQHTLADMSKTSEVLGFKAQVSLEHGIELIISSYS